MKKSVKRVMSIFLAFSLVFTGINLAFVPKASAAVGKEYYVANGSYVTQIGVAKDDDWFSSKNCKKELTNAGYTILDKDLNDNAGGDYIYMGYKMSSDRSKAIRRIHFVNHIDTNPLSYGGANYVPLRVPDLEGGALVDLNAGAGGKDIYTYYSTSENAGAPITALAVNTTENDSNYTYTGVWIASDSTDLPIGGAANLNADKNNASLSSKRIYLHYNVAPSVDTGALRTAISMANTYISNSSRYVSVAALTTARNNGTAITSDYDNNYGISSTYSQASIDSATTAINNALNALQTTVNLDSKTNGGAENTQSFNVTIGTNTQTNANLSGYTASKSGWNFLGWNSNKDATSGTKSTVTTYFNSIFYAIFSKEVTAVFNYKNAANEDKTSSSSSTVYNNGTSSTISAPSSDTVSYGGSMWTLSGWRTDNTAEAPQYTSSVSVGVNETPKSFYGVYTTGITIEYNANGGTDAPSNQNITQYYNSNNVKSFNLSSGIPSRNGYTFVGWSSSNSGSTAEFSPNSSVAFTSNKTLYAVWTTNPYVITFDANGGDAVSSTGYNIESTDTLPATTKTAYSFAGWDVSSAGGNWSGTYSAGNAVTGKYGDVTLKAKWTPVQYSVIYNTDGGTPIDNLSYNIESTDVLALPEKTGYTFTGWQVTTADGNWSGACSAGDSVIGKYGNVTLTAQWTKNIYEVGYDNLFFATSWGANAVAPGTLTVDPQTGLITVSSNGSTDKMVSDPNPSATTHYSVDSNREYVLSYDMTNNAADQNSWIWVYFWNSSDSAVTFSGNYEGDSLNDGHKVYSAQDAIISSPSNDTNRVALGLFQSDVSNESYGNFGHAYIKFTVPAGTSYVTFAFGNTDPNMTSQFKNIHLRPSELLDVSYSATMKTHTVDDAKLGELINPTRPGFKFLGWYTDETYTTAVTNESTAELQNKTIYSKWELSNDATESDAVIMDTGFKVAYGDCLENDEILNSYIDRNGYTAEIVAIGGYSEAGASAAYSSQSYLGAYGTFTLSGNTITYSSDKAISGKDTVYYAVEIKNGGVAVRYIYGKMNIIPATTIYYEDDGGIVTYKNGTVAGGTVGSTGQWSTKGTSLTASAVEHLSEAYYGSDAAYASGNTYSMGSAHFVTVNAKNNPNASYSGGSGSSWPTATFTFAGTGFDVVSLISNETGSVTVTIYEGTGTANKLKNYIVDTYYGYKLNENYDSSSFEADKKSMWTADPSGENALYQIPIIGKTDLSYGTYTVVITPSYSSRLDHNSQKDGYDFYLDAIRVYNPAGVGNGITDAEVLDKYLADGEYQRGTEDNISFRDMLESSSNDSQIPTTVFINEGKVDNATAAQYMTAGPKNEVYLKNNQAISFTLNNENYAKVLISVHSTGSGVPEMSIGSAQGSYTKAYPITTATTQYYEIPLSYVGKPVYITNTGSGILSVCNLKVTYSSVSYAMAAPQLTTFMSSENIAMVEAMLVGISANGMNKDGLFVPEALDVTSDNSEKVITGTAAEITVTTSSDVKKVLIDGEEMTMTGSNEDGTTNWSYVYVPDKPGTVTLNIAAYDADGYASETTEATITSDTATAMLFEKLTKILKMLVEFIQKAATILGQYN